MKQLVKQRNLSTDSRYWAETDQTYFKEIKYTNLGYLVHAILHGTATTLLCDRQISWKKKTRTPLRHKGQRVYNSYIFYRLSHSPLRHWGAKEPNDQHSHLYTYAYACTFHYIPTHIYTYKYTEGKQINTPATHTHMYC